MEPKNCEIIEAFSVPFKVVEWITPEDGSCQTGFVRFLDETSLPVKEEYIDCNNVEEVWNCIKRLVVRGAPAIGIAGAYGIVIALQARNRMDGFIEDLEQASKYLKSSRPTAVNLEWACHRMEHVGKELFEKHATDENSLLYGMLKEAMFIHMEDKRLCTGIGRSALDLFTDPKKPIEGVLTHCNAGALATGGIGTATAGIYLAHNIGVRFDVYCDETRPLLQGSRLTSWELSQNGINAIVITDSMAAQMMKEGRISLVIVGADRVAANGDAANKIGTYSLAIVAQYHQIPFYVAVPYSSFDLSLASGEDIPIEQRASEEIVNGFGRRTGPVDIPTRNPAFDVVPANLITEIITDRGRCPASKDGIEKLFAVSKS